MFVIILDYFLFHYIYFNIRKFSENKVKLIVRNSVTKLEFTQTKK